MVKSDVFFFLCDLVLTRDPSNQTAADLRLDRAATGIGMDQQCTQDK
jgi:hypothetical protein